MDLKKFNVIGTNDHYNKFIGNSNSPKGINYGDHWLYGHYEKEKNTYVIDNYLLERSISIKKFYNATEERYYDIGDEKFIWPEIAHGYFKDNYQLYSIIVQNAIIKQ